MADTYKSTTDRAAEIRQRLKAPHGWSSRQVSVRAEYFSMGSSINVTVKDPAVPLSVVEAIANEHERIDRCQITGDILSGGNRYVHVRYSSEALAALGRPYTAAVERAAGSLTPGSRALAEVEGTEYLIGIPQAGRFQIWSRNGYLTDCDEAEHAARYIAQRIHG